MRRALLFGLLTVVWAGGPARSHDFTITDVLLIVKNDGTYQVDMTLDVDALALGVSSDVPSAELVAELEGMSIAEFEGAVDRAVDTLRRRVRVRFDGEREDFSVGFPELETPIERPGLEPTVMGITARLSGAIPDGAAEVVFRASRSFGVVQLTLFDQTSLASERHLLEPAEDSPAYRIGSQPDAAAGPGRTEVAGRYLVLGFEHILPLGVDHILFVVGLFLLSTRLKPLLWQVTAFTVAHTVTLGLAAYGVVSLPPRLVEPLIALSIAYVGIENLFVDRLRPWRPALVFGFGLLHGMGFAGVLKEIGLPQGEFLAALIGFNVGVELGQLAVVTLAFLAVGWARKKPWYRAAIVRPASAAIALTGLVWAIQRTFY
jgi:hypothetical protein